MSERSDGATRGTVELTAIWRARLADSGFEDIERDGDDYLTNGRGGRVAATIENTEAGALVLADARAQQEAAVEALRAPAVWRGLPRAARRWWALQAICGWSEERAGRFVRVRHRRGVHAGCTRHVTHRTYDRWRAVILARICGRGAR